MNISDTDLTPQEMQRLSEALKNEEFKSLFLDYVKEISDPENRKLYEAELVALEAEQGRDLTFVNPEPLFCVKTSDSHGLKVFINICSSDAINEAVAKKSGKGSHWSIPYSLGSPRDDVDAGT
jgi:dynein assembly factor 2